MSSVPKWREVQRSNFTSLFSLLDFLNLEKSLFVHRKHFPLNLPYRLAAKMHKGTLSDPILRQFVPLKEEQAAEEGYLSDPVGDKTFRHCPRLLHKYQGRALLLTTSSCAMHCRYCFRQHFPYAKAKAWEEEIAYLQKETSIKEVILSGGDPLSLSDANLQHLLTQLSLVPHLSLLRIHTRFPIGIPERITKDLLKLLKETRLQVIFVIHINHPHELDNDIFDALKSVQKEGIPTLCQSVLLKGVNDCDKILTALCWQLVTNGIIPYYLHQLDQVKGASHFHVDIDHGRQLIAKMRKQLPGYAMPQFVQEIPGSAHKTPL